MTDLRAFIEEVSEIVSDIYFKPDDEMMAHIWAEDRKGEMTMFACPMFPGDEIMFRVGIPAKLRRERWRRWCFFAEAWMTPNLRPGELPAQRPDRMEVVTFAAEDATGATLMASRQILRLPGLPAKLLPLVFKQTPSCFVMAPPP
jgi:hypothetical protein